MITNMNNDQHSALSSKVWISNDRHFIIGMMLTAGIQPKLVFNQARLEGNCGAFILQYGDGSPGEIAWTRLISATAQGTKERPH